MYSSIFISLSLIFYAFFFSPYVLVSSQVSNIFQSMCQCVLQYYNRSWHHNVGLNHMPLGQLIMCSLLANASLSEISVLVTGACQSLFNFLFTHPFYVRTVYKRIQGLRFIDKFLQPRLIPTTKRYPRDLLLQKIGMNMMTCITKWPLQECMLTWEHCHYMLWKRN